MLIAKETLASVDYVEKWQAVKFHLRKYIYLKKF